MTRLSKGYEPDRRQLALAMFRTVRQNYGRLISEARKEWERRFAGTDPSDSCVTIRVNGKDSPEFARFFPLQYSQPPESLASN